MLAALEEKKRRDAMWVTNPLSGKLIKRDGPTWKKLMREAIVRDDDSRDVGEVMLEADSVEEAKAARRAMKQGAAGPNRNLRRVGKRVVAIRRTPAREEVFDAALSRAAEALRENRDNLLHVGDDELADALRELVVAKMKPVGKPLPMRRPKARQPAGPDPAAAERALARKILTREAAKIRRESPSRRGRAPAARRFAAPAGAGFTSLEDSFSETAGASTAQETCCSATASDDDSAADDCSEAADYTDGSDASLST